MKKFIFLFSVGLLIISCSFLMKKIETKIVVMKDDSAISAGKIVDYYHSKGRLVNFSNIYQTIKAIKRFKPEKLTDFDLIDLLAIAMLESDFDSTAVSYADAVGVWQVTHIEEFLRTIDGTKNSFDIKCNTDMGLRILLQKLEHFDDKRLAIIGYNGIVYNDKGVIIDKYYIEWKIRRKILEEIL